MRGEVNQIAACVRLCACGCCEYHRTFPVRSRRLGAVRVYAPQTVGTKDRCNSDFRTVFSCVCVPCVLLRACVRVRVRSPLCVAPRQREWVRECVCVLHVVLIVAVITEFAQTALQSITYYHAQ